MMRNLQKTKEKYLNRNVFIYNLQFIPYGTIRKCDTEQTYNKTLSEFYPKIIDYENKMNEKHFIRQYYTRK